MDHAAARVAFENALATHSPGFGTFFLARLLDLEITYGEDICTVQMAVLDFMYNPQSSLHGGLIATVMDISMGHLLTHAIGIGMTLEMRTQFLRPVRAGIIRAEARFLKKGRSINFLESRLSDAEGRDIAAASSTWQLL